MIINATIKTKHSGFRIEKEGETGNTQKWTIFVKSEPKDNKANMEIIKELSKKYKNVKILRGIKSKNKTILVE